MTVADSPKAEGVGAASPASSRAGPSGHRGSSGDLISTASSALRRLHFKSSAVRNHHPQVPKLVIMGSSSTSTCSNNTINTSTDSATTVATLITVTDGEVEHNMSVDLPDSVFPPTSPPPIARVQSPPTTTAPNSTCSTPPTPVVSIAPAPIPSAGVVHTAVVLESTEAGGCKVNTVVVGPVTETPAAAETSTSTSLESKREKNMKQLLEVTNTVTLQELRDFEMKYGSPHHSRSQSVRAPGRPNYLCLPQQRCRVASMPNTGVEEEYYRLRHFSITGKGIVNRGDSLKSRRSRSNNSVASTNSSHSEAVCGSARTSASASLASSRESSAASAAPDANSPYRVIILGAPGVGKSSIVSQFLTSEYLHAYDTSLDDEFGEKSVCVLLNGEESELTFIDSCTAEMSPEMPDINDGQAFVVVFSSSDRSSLSVAERQLQSLWQSEGSHTRAIILVANKTDLVRSRVISTHEGKCMATSYDCKYIETSVAINHNVDELLVGILTQIRLKHEQPEPRAASRRHQGRNTGGSFKHGNRPYRGSRTTTSLKVKGLLNRVWQRDSKSKSCENLHVL